MTKTSHFPHTLCGLALVLLAGPLTASAVDVSVKVEPGVALPLNAPQSERFTTGGGQSAKLLFGLTPFLDVGPTATFTMLPSAVDGDEAGVIWGYGAGMRLKRSHEAEGALGISPWLDADVLYIRTGELNRAGFDTAVGLSVPIGEARTFWVGPFVRFLQVAQAKRVGFDTRDSRTLTVGLSFEAGSGRERVEEVRYIDREVPADCPGVPPCPPVAVVVEEAPVYERIVVHPDKLELKEKIFFAWDESRLEAASFPVLDEVAMALNDNPEFRVQVEGHTDSTGPYAHNQTLSEERAQAVLDYLVRRGVEKSRLTSEGFSSSAPTNTNTTDYGREQNRRVDFVVHFILLDGEN